MSTIHEIEETEVKSFAKFEVKAVPDDKASEDAGEVVYRDAIVLTVAHSKNQIVQIEAEPRHAQQYPREWAQFKKTDEFKAYTDSEKEQGNVTPIEQLKALPSIMISLRTMGFRSVEAFAKADPDAVAHLHGAAKLQEKAKKMVEPKNAAPQKAVMGNKAA